MYTFISIISRFFVALLFLGYSLLCFAIFMAVPGSQFRMGLKDILVGLLAGAQKIGCLCLGAVVP